MKLLALETATEYCSAALWLDGTVLQREEHAGQRHSQLLLPQCQSLIAEAGLCMADLDGIAFASGPGSFTGLRIGCAVAQGLALGLDLPVVGISSLLALAAAMPEERVLACLDARMGEIYYAAYQRTGAGWRVVSPPQVCRPEAIASPDDEGWLGCGSGFAAHGAVLVARLQGRLKSVDAAAYPQARHVAALAAIEMAAGRQIPADLAAPLYVRDRVALKICER